MHSRVKALLITAAILCACLLGCAAYAYGLQAEGWHCGSAEEGIALYAGIEQENVQIHESRQDGDFIYTVWEDAATGRVSMTALQQQKKLGRSYLCPWGSASVGESGQAFDIFRYHESDTAGARSLVVIACDNRNNSLDRCELVYTECGSDGYARSHSETVELAEPFLLQTQWFSGNVYCVGAAFDRQGNIVVRAGGYVEDFKLPSA